MSSIEIRIRREHDRPAAGKLAEAELHFTGGVLDGLKLVGFAVWEGRNGGERYVSLPARQYFSDGERRTYLLVRPVSDSNGDAQKRLRSRILQAYIASAPVAENAAVS